MGRGIRVKYMVMERHRNSGDKHNVECQTLYFKDVHLKLIWHYY